MQVISNLCIDSIPNEIDECWSLFKNHPSLESLWEEYTSSFQGKPAIRDLNLKFGAKWRNKPSARKMYQRRQYVYKAVCQVADAKRISELEAVKLLDRKRAELKQTVASFQDKVCKCSDSINNLLI
jgi:hypothetical protein